MKNAYLNLNFSNQLKLWVLSILNKEVALFPVIINQTMPFKNVMISGEFFPFSEIALRNKLINIKANIQSYMTLETDILICGKDPDWDLVEEARIYGVDVLFIDKINELLREMTVDDIAGSFEVPDEEPLGI